MDHFPAFQVPLLSYYKQRANPYVHFLKRLSKVRNTKDNIEHLFAAMQTQLEADYTPKGVIHRAKEHFATPASHTLLEELHRTCDAVIVAAGA